LTRISPRRSFLALSGYGRPRFLHFQDRFRSHTGRLNRRRDLCPLWARHAGHR
jgi:hypothetical protein